MTDAPCDYCPLPAGSAACFTCRKGASMTTSPREALERLTRWREAGASTGVFVSAESARHAFAADVSALLSTVEQMREALTKARHEERERCALTAESALFFHGVVERIRDGVVATIRALPDPAAPTEAQP